MAQQTAVEFIEEGIKARQKHWQDQYQQGYQRALSDIMSYIEEAKQTEKEQIKKAFADGQETPINNPTTPHYSNEEYYNDTHKK